VYFYLDKLVQKGLVTYKIKGKRKGIAPVVPSVALNDFINAKSEEVAQNKKVVQELIPQLLRIVQARTESTQVHLYEGKPGIYAVIDAMLRENKDDYWLGSADNFIDIINEEQIYHRLTLQRMKQKTTAYGITDRRVLKKKRLAETLGEFRKFRFLDKDIIIPAGLMLFGDYTSITIKRGKEVKVILIKDSATTQLLRLMFMLLWDKLPEK
jgi:sugar-specific transcriptional regulator TrmB